MKWTKLTLSLLFQSETNPKKLTNPATVWFLDNFCKTSLDNFGADSGDLDRSLYNLSMIARLLPALTHFAETSAELFTRRVTKHTRGLITYLIRGILVSARGHSVEDTAVVDERFPRETRL